MQFVEQKQLSVHGNEMIRGVGRYKGFGLRQEWFHRILTHGEDWNVNSPLGNRQVEGFTQWLIDTGLWD